MHKNIFLGFFTIFFAISRFKRKSILESGSKLNYDNCTFLQYLLYKILQGTLENKFVKKKKKV
jgi:hypothetical protein